MEWNHFKHGLEMIFKKWTGLQMAIAYSDYDTAQEDLIQLTFDFFKEESSVEVDELENNLEGFVLDQLDCQLEDNSPNQVSRDVCELFNQLKNGNVEYYSKLKEAFGQGNVSAEVSDSDEDSDMEVEERVVQERKKPEPVIDEDGFELVQKGRRR